MTKDMDIMYRNTEQSNNGNYDMTEIICESSEENRSETSHIQSLYPGQPEKEDCADESIPPTTDCASDRMLQSHKTAEDHTVDKGQEVEEDIIEIPVFIKATDVIMKRYRLMMYNHMTKLLRSGRLSQIVGFPFLNQRMNAQCLKFGFISFWKINRSSFFADVSVRLKLDVGSKRTKEWRGKLVLNCGFDEDGFHCKVEDLTANPDRENYIGLSPYLVPYLHNKDVDKEAERIWRKYLPEALDDPIRRNPHVLATRMGLTIKYYALYNNMAIHSILFYEDSELVIHGKKDPNRAMPATLLIPKNTIVINSNKIKREYSSFDIFHECMHFENHYMAYRLQGLATNDTRKVKTKKIKRTEGKKEKDPIYYMEVQANRAAYALMMPEKSFRKMIMKEYDRAGECRHEGYRYQIIGKRLAHTLMLPDFRIRARMIQLGYTPAKGALNYVERQPIEPFAFNTEAWKDEQHTFVIDRSMVGRLLKDSADFREIMKNNRYVYADGHVVRNDPRFVRNADGTLLLTEWANAHVDKCCLRFVRVYVQMHVGKYIYGRMYYDSDYIIQTQALIQPIMDSEGVDEIEALHMFIQNFPKTFKEAVTLIRKIKKMKLEDLAKALNISVMTYTRWLEEPAKYGGIDFIAALALILQAPDWASDLLFKKAHLQLDEDDRRHQVIHHILRVRSNDGIKAANDYLKEKNLAPLLIREV